VTAIGVTRGRLLQHYCDHGLEPGAQPVTNAVRASLAMAFPVDTSETGLTEYDVGAAERARLVESGAAAARDFLAGWDWGGYV
jgi:hypothetical protein